MKGTSKVIMGATLVMVVILATVLALVLVLLAELYCSILLRRHRRRKPTTTSTTATASTTPPHNSSSPSHPLQHQIFSPKHLRTFYAHGVLDASRSFLYPAVEKQQQQNTQETPLAAAWSPPLSPPFIISLTPPNPPDKMNPICYDEDGGEHLEHLVYICNPIYNDEFGSRVDTPFETPDTSPSRLGDDGFPAKILGEGSSLASSSSLDSWVNVAVSTPVLTPMRKLPVEGCSVSLKDARSLATSSCSNSHSYSSSASPCTSPSW